MTHICVNRHRWVNTCRIQITLWTRKRHPITRLLSRVMRCFLWGFWRKRSLEHSKTYSISQEICTRFLLCCAFLWLYIDWFSISIRLTSLALWQSDDCPSASKATLMKMDKYFIWIHYERLHNHNKAKHNKTVCIFLGIYCTAHTIVSWHGPKQCLMIHNSDLKDDNETKYTFTHVIRRSVYHWCSK